MAKVIPPEEAQLSNGIPVIFQPHFGTAAAVYWWNQVGSGDEGPGEYGFAHFLEHMLFKDASAKDTGRASTGQLARAIESLGGDINAYTSYDQTVYYFNCAEEHLEKALDVFGTMAKPQKFLKGDFVREREVILEELARGEDSPSRQHFQKLFSATYAKHPYRRPVIGYRKTLKAANVGMLERFYKRNYVTARMGLIVVGAMTPKRKKGLLRILEKRFGKTVRKPVKAEPFKRPQEPELRKGIELSTLPFAVQVPSLEFALRVPRIDHPDVAALDMLAGVLGMGELSRLYQRLFYRESLVTDVAAHLYVPRDPGVIFFTAEMEEISKVEPTWNALLEELHRMGAEPPTQEEMERVWAASESERLYATQTADGQAGRLGFLKFVAGNLGYDDQFLRTSRDLQPEDVSRAARKYLIPERGAAVVMVPKIAEALDLKRMKILAAQKLKHRGRSLPGQSSAEPEVEEIQRPSGLRVTYLHRPYSHAFSVHASVLGGSRLEWGASAQPSMDWGVSNLMGLTWAKGTQKKSAREVSQITESRAARLDGFSGRNTIGLELNGLARDWQILSDLFSEVCFQPSFAADEVEHSRRVTEESIRSIEDSTAQLCSRMFLETLFETHPYGKLTYGSLESVAAMKRDRLVAFHRAWVRPERMVLSVVGAVDRSQLEKFLNQFEAAWESVPEDSVKIPQQVTAETPLRSPRWAKRALDREQLHIMVGGLGSQVQSPERYALRILQTILGGQSGRLFIELREKKSLAYSVSPIGFEGIEPGYLGTYIACSPAKHKESLDGMKKVLEVLAKKGPTRSEMQRAKEFCMGRRAMDLESDSAQASYLGLQKQYGVELLTQAEVSRRLGKVTPQEIQQVCRSYFVDPPMVTSVVG